MQQQNEICFPAGILQSPFFSVSYDDASNYGAIGVVIGHEITHNFDTSGRLFDIDGNMKDWWGEGDADKFNELTKNTIERFDNMAAMPFLLCNGKLTLNENIADFGGLKIAYRALEKVMSGRNDELVDGFTWQQRFFISYAQVWANVSTDEMIKQNVLNNCHSVPMVRVNGTLPMFTPWYEAFGVNSDSKLFVEEDKRAKIW
jgi:putative endopeptidase